MRMSNKKRIGDIQIKNDSPHYFIVTKYVNKDGKDYEVDRLKVPYSKEFAEAYDADNVTPFISALQKRSQKTVGMNIKHNIDSRISEIRKSIKKKGLKVPSAYEIKKRIHMEAERVKEERKLTIINKLSEIEKNREAIDKKYEGCEIENKDKMTLNHLKDGTTLVYNRFIEMRDNHMGFKPEDEIDENTKWELYGEPYVEKEGENNGN